MLQLYKNIKERRILLGMTQTELAKKLGYADKSMIAKIEKGIVDLTQSKIISFAKVLYTTPGELMGWENNPDKLTENFEENLAYLKSHGEDDLIELYQKIKTDKNLVMLVDKACELTPEQVEQTLRIIDTFKKETIDQIKKRENRE